MKHPTFSANIETSATELIHLTGNQFRAKLPNRWVKIIFYGAEQKIIDQIQKHQGNWNIFGYPRTDKAGRVELIQAYKIEAAEQNVESQLMITGRVESYTEGRNTLKLRVYPKSDKVKPFRLYVLMKKADYDRIVENGIEYVSIVAKPNDRSKYFALKIKPQSLSVPAHWVEWDKRRIEKENQPKKAKRPYHFV